jgi:hypothetical protein
VGAAPDVFFPGSEAGQTFPHAPQWAGLLSTWVSQPSASAPSVLTVPPLQFRNGQLHA